MSLQTLADLAPNNASCYWVDLRVYLERVISCPGKQGAVILGERQTGDLTVLGMRSMQYLYWEVHRSAQRTAML